LSKSLTLASALPNSITLDCCQREPPLGHPMPAPGSRSADHTINGPSWSKLGLAPVCSTRFFQLSPRK